MENFLKSVLDEPQVYAAVITAIFGILGIIINIFINFWFRNRDYKYKNHMQQLEGLESYYYPLMEKINSLRKSVNCFGKDDNLFNLVQGQPEAIQAAAVRELKNILDECKVFFSQTSFKYPYDYKLYFAHKRVKENIMVLCGVGEKRLMPHDERITKETMLLCLEDLMYRIQLYENDIVINNVIEKYKEKIRIRNSYKKQAKEKELGEK